MFLAPIKLRLFKFSPYLILKVLLVPQKNSTLSMLVPTQIKLFNLCLNS